MPGVAHDRHFDRKVLRDIRRIDIDMDDARIGTEGVDLAGHAVIEARADREQYIALVHGHV